MNSSPRYRPIRVEDAAMFDQVKGTVRAKNVHYQLSDGTKSYVTIPHEEYTPERVQSELENAATMHERVMQVRDGNAPPPPPGTDSPWG